MLDKKTIYTIYLAHKVNNLLVESTFKVSGDCDSNTLDKIHLKRYLDYHSRITGNFTRTSIMNFIAEMRNIVDELNLPVEEQSEFPRNLRQFHQSFARWQKAIDTATHQ